MRHSILLLSFHLISPSTSAVDSAVKPSQSLALLQKWRSIIKEIVDQSFYSPVATQGLGYTLKQSFLAVGHFVKYVIYEGPETQDVLFIVSCCLIVLGEGFNIDAVSSLGEVKQALKMSNIPLTASSYYGTWRLFRCQKILSRLHIVPTDAILHVVCIQAYKLLSGLQPQEAPYSMLSPCGSMVTFFRNTKDGRILEHYHKYHDTNDNKS